jgi:hypothetical protein
MALGPMALPCHTMRLQYPNDLLFSEATAIHVLVLMLSQNEPQTGLCPWGNVTTGDDPGQQLATHIKD